VDLPLKTRMALWWNRPREKTNGPVGLAIRKERYPITNLLVLLPKKPEHSHMARMFIQVLQNAMGPEGRLQIRYIAIRRNLEYVDSSINDRLITYSKEHVNRWGLPHKSFLDLIFTSQPDAVIDLNLEFDPFTVAIAQHSNAPMRIGFYTEEGEKYYNILIKRKGSDYIEKGFLNIQQLLGLT
jgi:hypothetical protein|tara:strand:+ start:9167 stop:9715 length:549 start_codon:yes stop_codon:yes gene_type:complete